ncbi:hypothetical protein CAEBREN_25405 [Caenorhabditis brenneri]|uniref:F-box domain-containing protein n=1 Tax=Caenorhabditis brenneri TaxID=135651 RepID=G0NS65_CAEBE|nr:hypothetical protein CAEBREN_25405 [Caenorhabditis brenneri]
MRFYTKILKEVISFRVTWSDKHTLFPTHKYILSTHTCPFCAALNMNKIPLHQLPDKAYIHALRSMEINDQLTYSLCSKNTKEDIKSLNLKKSWINIYVHNSIELEICTEENVALIFYTKYDNSFPNNQFIARENIKVVVDPYGESKRWESNFQNFGLKEYLHHFCDVLRHSKYGALNFFGENLDENSIGPIQKVIEGLQIEVLVIGNQLTPEFTKKALKSFPNCEKLFLDPIPFESHEVFKMDKYFIQNLRSVSIPDIGEINIDKVLVSNSERISIHDSKFSEIDLNRFLKLWICGSNPRLRNFYTMGQPLFGRDSLDMNLVLKGIESKQIPLDSEEVHREKVDEDDYEETKLTGGYRIRSFNGTTAVIMPLEAGHIEFMAE